jgi:hypothetical protein
MRVYPVAVALGVLAVLASTAAAAPAAEVTMTLQRIFDPACNCTRLHFSGTIASGAADEYVEVLQQRCGYRASMSFSGALTKAGGSWEAVIMGAGYSATYRARWKGRLSEPATVRPPVPSHVEKLPGRRYRISIDTSTVIQNMSGRIVELQRQPAGTERWIRVRRARLVADPKRYRTFTATFAVRTRGLTLRIIVPARTAAPCYTASDTGAFTS